ncbi:MULTISPECIES: helix-turn-helix domain-containing protein [unclassified Streptomyces]|uniref:helix-turn-helix domain-containing protein n=1 Tax=unclassified Streptomyces TaxID=2593676 RepID=UPI00034E6DBD|nr:helix-turn-helix domain-containing protein [Streptomyces sp. HGB0020]EPD62384.1 hypothetical protein HMPREF1211_04018 [Streptomyces sp. HGB0020]
MREQTPTLDEIRGWPATVSVVQAARALGISRATFYRLIAANQAPVRVIDFMTTKRVVTNSIIRLLEAE